MKIRYLTLLLAPLLSNVALAGAGFTGPGAQTAHTVAAAHAAPDKTPVVVQGHIIQKLKDEKYEFKDATGTLTVEIDDEDMPPVSFSDKTRVKLTGEVDKGLLSRGIDVDVVDIIN